jgi:hypothetical protein
MRFVFLPLVLAACLVGQSTEQHLRKSFIVRISEGFSTLSPTPGPNNLSNCLVVMPDGRMHLELRRQEFLDGRAVLTTYESALHSNEMEILRGIVDDVGVKALPRFAAPVVPMDVDDWQVFQAEIARGTEAQQVGYVTWHGHGPNNSEADKAAWNQATKVLQNLVDWSHATKSSKSVNWRKGQNPNSFCGR